MYLYDAAGGRIGISVDPDVVDIDYGFNYSDYFFVYDALGGVP